jgi:ABC-type bacteriocin/lantibiotic exporter with double-glycine peptidase domain
LIALVLLIVGGFLVINQQMNIGQFVASEIIILLVLSSVEKLIVSLDVIYDVFTAIEKIGQVTDLPLEVNEGEHLDNNLEAGMAISIRDLSFKSHYSPRKLLDRLSIEIKANQLVSVVSDSSASSNALFYLLAGICDNAKGSISFDKVPQVNLNIAELREQIGTLFEHDHLVNGSIFENIQFGRKDVSLKTVVRFAEEIGLTDFINSLPEKYETLIDSEGHFIPKDVELKILMLRSLVKKPRLLLFNEPTAAINTTQKEQILKMINDSVCVTRIIATQDPLIHSISDVVIQLENGKPRIEESNQPSV